MNQPSTLRNMNNTMWAYGGSQNRHATLEVEHNAPKFSFSCNIKSDCLIRNHPIGQTYLEMLTNWLISILAAKGGDKNFQQDDTPLHWHRTFLNCQTDELTVLHMIGCSIGGYPKIARPNCLWLSFWEMSRGQFMNTNYPLSAGRHHWSSPRLGWIYCRIWTERVFILDSKSMNFLWSPSTITTLLSKDS